MQYQRKPDDSLSIRNSKLGKRRKKPDKKKSLKSREQKRKAQGLVNERNYQHPPPDTSTFRVIEKHLGRKIKKAFDDKGIVYEYINDTFTFAVKRKVIRQVVRNLEDIISWCRNEYKRYLIPDQEIFSRKQWIWNNKKIHENLNKRRNKKLIRLMDYLGNHRLGWKQSETLSDDISAGSFSIKTKKGNDVERTFVLVIPDFEDIEDKLDMSKPLIQKYLQGMGEAGIIKPIRKAGSHGQKVYALGYYHPYSPKDSKITRHKPNWFLKSSKEMKQALIKFYRPE
jgi:predicted transcriptional regulator